MRGLITMDYIAMVLENDFTVFFITVILVVFSIAFLTTTFPLFFIHKKIKKVYKKVKEYSDYENTELIQEFHEDESDIAMKVVAVLDEANNGKHSIEKLLNPHEILSIPSRRKIANQVPGILTALGILGTFIGLQMGLPSLRQGTGSEVAESVQAIALGLETAFISSIFGISCSILWNLVDKNIWRRSNNMLYHLTSLLMNRLESMDPTRLVFEIKKFQQQQTEMMKTMVADFAAQLENVLVPSIRTSIESSITPSMEKMEGILQNLSDVSSQNQLEGVGKIVDHFVDSMNESLQGHFVELGNTISQLIDWQKATKSDLDVLIKEMKNSAVSQREINKVSDKILKTFDSYFVQVEASTEKMLEHHKDLKELTSQLKVATEKNHTLFEQVMKRSQSIDQSNEQYIQTMTEVIRKMEKSWAEARSTLEVTKEGFDQASQMFGESMHQGLMKSFEEFDKNVTQIAGYFQTNYEEIKEASDAISKNLDHAVEGIREVVDRLDQTINDVPKQIQVSIDKDQTV